MLLFFIIKTELLWDKGNYKKDKEEGEWVGYNKDGTVGKNGQEPSRTERRLVIK